MASGNKNWGSDKPSSINNLTVIDGNDNLKTSKEILWDVFNRGRETEPFSWEMISRECLKHLELYQKRLNLTLETCSSENLNDKSIENLLILLNCFDLQKSLESTQDITKLKVAVLTWNYDCIRNLIDHKINKIDINNQSAYICLVEIIQVVIVGIELLLVCALDPLKKPEITKELKLIKQLCDHRVLALMVSHFDELWEVEKKDVKLSVDYIANAITYCEAIMFSWFSTDPSQSKIWVKKTYDDEKEKLESIRKFFKENKNNESLKWLLDLSSDRFNRNYVFLDTYIELLYLKFQERTFYNIDCQNDKEKFNIEDIFKDQQKSIIILLHSYTQVAGYENGDPRVTNISDKINLLQSVGWVGLWKSSANKADDSIDSIMLVVDAIFEDFLENLKNDHFAIWELFLVISSIVHFVTFKDVGKIREFQNKINDIIEIKKITWEWFYYQTGALNFWDTMMEIAADNKKMIDLMSSLSVTDSLTWISNRLQFDRDFTIDLIKVARESNEKDYQSNKWIFSLDIDYFKTINDKYGHDAWDTVLKEFTKAITSEIRSTDRFYRIGWEEFTILCECNTQEDAFVFWEKILSAVEFKLSNTLRKLKIFKAFGEEKITMSVWAYNIENNQWKYSANNLPEFSSMCLKKADESLYKTKNSGRNWITIDGNYVPHDDIKDIISKSNVSKLKTVV